MPVRLSKLIKTLASRNPFVAACHQARAMADRYHVVAKLLLERLPGWYVVPVRNHVEPYALIQNRVGKRVPVPISQNDVDDLSHEELLNRICTAIQAS